MINVITLVGRLTRDPETRKTNSGVDVVSFTLANDMGKAVNGEKQTLFMDCSVFGKQAEIVTKFVRKGHLLGVSGKLASRKYVSKEGTNVTAYSILVDHVDLMEPKEKEGAGLANADTNVGAPVVEEKLPDFSVSEDQLPF